MNIDGIKGLRPNLCPGIRHPARCITKHNQEYSLQFPFIMGPVVNIKKERKKKHQNKASGNREQGRQIAQF